MKKQSIVALLLFLLIPLVFRLESLLMGAIDPEKAAGHPNYTRNYHWLSELRNLSFFTSLVIVLALWIVVCLLVIRAKKQPARWLFLAIFGPLGFAVLSMLNDRAPSATDLYAHFQRRMHWLLRAAWEIGFFVLAWILAEQAMVFKRNLMIRHQAAVTGLSIQQIIDSQNASSGMWAFAEGNEVMYFVILFYLLLPFIFWIAGRSAALIAHSGDS